MRGFAGLAATGLMLVLAMPAAARDRTAEVGEAKSFRPVGATARQASHVSQSQMVTLDGGGLLPAEDPTAPRLFGSVPVADNMNVGVGLFSVLGLTEKEQLRRRMDPSRDLHGNADTRVAAVGMSLRF